MKILETIQRHVTDAAQLTAISDELLGLVPGAVAPPVGVFAVKALPVVDWDV